MGGERAQQVESIALRGMRKGGGWGLLGGGWSRETGHSEILRLAQLRLWKLVFDLLEKYATTAGGGNDVRERTHSGLSKVGSVYSDGQGPGLLPNTGY